MATNQLMSTKFKLYRYPWKLFTQESEEYDEITPLEGIEEIPDIYELILNDMKLDLNLELKQALEKYQLIYLGLTKCQLTSLENLPQIPTLKRLQLDFNQISSLNLDYYNDFLISLSVMANHLDLSGECPFTQMKALKQLSIIGNKYDDYQILRNSYLEQMPDLIFLDGLGRDDEIRLIQFKNQQEEARYLGWYKLKSPILNLKDDSIEIVPKKKTKKKKDQVVRFNLGSSRGRRNKKVKVEEPESEQEELAQIDKSQSEHGHVKTEFNYDQDQPKQSPQIGSQINTIDFDKINSIRQDNDDEDNQDVIKVNKKIKKNRLMQKPSSQQLKEESQPYEEQQVQAEQSVNNPQPDNQDVLILTPQKISKKKNIKGRRNIQIKQEASPEQQDQQIPEEKSDVQFLGQNTQNKPINPNKPKTEDISIIHNKIFNQPIETTKSKQQINIKKPKQMPTQKEFMQTKQELSQQQQLDQSEIKATSEPKSVQDPPNEKQNIKKPKQQQQLNKSTPIIQKQTDQSDNKEEQDNSPQASPLNQIPEKKKQQQKKPIQSKTPVGRSKPNVSKKQKQEANNSDSESKSKSPVPRRSSRPKQRINYSEG